MMRTESETIVHFEKSIAKFYNIALAISKKNILDCPKLKKKELLMLNKAKYTTNKLNEFRDSLKNNSNVYNLKNEVIEHFANFGIKLKFDSRNLSEEEIYICFDFENEFKPFDNLAHSKVLKLAVKELYFCNQYFDYCLAKDSKIELFNYEFYTD